MLKEQMIYLLNKTTSNIDLQRGRYLIKPLGYIEVNDHLREDPDVEYAVEKGWMEISTKQPKSHPDGVPTAVSEFFNPQSGLSVQEVKELVRKQKEKYAPRILEPVPTDPLEDKAEIPVVTKSKGPEEIKPEDLKAALGKTEEKAEEEKKTSMKPAKKKTETPEELGSFT